MSDDGSGFTWQPRESRRRAFPYLVIGIVSAFAALGVVLANTYPLRTLTAAVQQGPVTATPPAAVPVAVTTPEAKGKVRTAAVAADRPAAAPSRPAAPEPQRTAAEKAAPPVVLLNPGSAEQTPAPPDRAAPAIARPRDAQRAAEPPDTASAAAPARRLAATRPTERTEPPRRLERQEKARAPRRGDGSVLVVVRRATPPYDTRVLRGRMRDGRLVVNGHDRRGMILRY